MIRKFVLLESSYLGSHPSRTTNKLCALGKLFNLYPSFINCKIVLHKNMCLIELFRMRGKRANIYRTVSGEWYNTKQDDFSHIVDL